MALAVTREEDRIVVAVGDELNADGASRVLALLRAGAGPDDLCILDVTRARWVEPSALAVIADSELSARIGWRGLSRHHERILRHLVPARVIAAGA